MTSALVTVDASAVGYRGTVALSGKDPVAFTGRFTEKESKASSTEREIVGYAAGSEAVASIYEKLCADDLVSTEAELGAQRQQAV
jgi:hypothetical protein